MEINKEYVQRVLKSGGMESSIEGDYLILDNKTPEGWTVKLYTSHKGISIDVWIEKPKPEFGAWVPVHIPTGNSATAYLSGCIRWVVSAILKSPGILDVASTQPIKND